MSKQPKDVRLPFMASQDEAEAIDQWRFSRKIGSRAEAMRRLVGRGLLLDNALTIAQAYKKIIERGIEVKESDLMLLNLGLSTLIDLASGKIKSGPYIKSTPPFHLDQAINEYEGGGDALISMVNFYNKNKDRPK